MSQESSRRPRTWAWVAAALALLLIFAAELVSSVRQQSQTNEPKGRGTASLPRGAVNRQADLS
jgi:hypothetical protein